MAKKIVAIAVLMLVSACVHEAYAPDPYGAIYLSKEGK
jgi:hypothetical protein